jgi:hypothetical protein
VLKVSENWRKPRWSTSRSEEVANKIWEDGAVHNLQAAETSRGKTVIEDFSGLYRDKNAEPRRIENHKSGGRAQSHVEETERRRLNEGENFSGFLARRLVGHVYLFVGTHPVHGVTTVVDVPNSHDGKKVEVLIGDTSQTLLLSRNEYFGQLEVEPVSDHDIDQICGNYHKRHIAMER